MNGFLESPTAGVGWIRHSMGRDDWDEFTALDDDSEFDEADGGCERTVVRARASAWASLGRIGRGRDRSDRQPIARAPVAGEPI